MSEAPSGTPKLNAALAKAQAAFEAASKDAINPAFKDVTNAAKAKGTRYADLTAVVEATRPALTANELAVTQEPMEALEGWVKVRTTLLHSSGEERSSILALPCAQKTAQAYGSALTYARRYAYSAMVGVVVDADDDGNAASAVDEKNAKRSTTPKAAAPKADTTPAPLPADALEKEKALLMAAAQAARTPADVDALRPRFNKLPKQDQDELGPHLTARKAELAKVATP